MNLEMSPALRTLAVAAQGEHLNVPYVWNLNIQFSVHIVGNRVLDRVLNTKYLHRDFRSFEHLVYRLPQTTNFIKSSFLLLCTELFHADISPFTIIQFTHL